MRSASTYLKAAGVVVLVGALVAGYVVFSSSPALQRMLRPDTVRDLLDGLGPWGPAAVVGTMAVAIVFSPIPSAPFVLGAGGPSGFVGFHPEASIVRGSSAF